MENVSSAVDREYLEKDINFLNKMKKIANKPKNEQRHTARGLANKGYKDSRRF